MILLVFNPFISSNKLTPLNRIFLERLVVIQVTNKFYFETWKFIAVSHEPV
jgi:hypothetical protein